MGLSYDPSSIRKTLLSSPMLWSRPQLKSCNVLSVGYANIQSCDSCIAGIILASNRFLSPIQGAGQAITCNVLYGMGPGILKNCLNLWTPAYTHFKIWLRGSSSGPTIGWSLVGVDQREGFPIVISHLWNSFPTEACFVSSLYVSQDLENGAFYRGILMWIRSFNSPCFCVYSVSI